MILSTLVTSQLHFEMCAGLYGHPVYLADRKRCFILCIEKFDVANKLDYCV